MTSELVYFRLQPPGVFCRVTDAGIQATSPADRASVFTLPHIRRTVSQALLLSPLYGRMMHAGMLPSPRSHMLARGAIAYPCWNGRVPRWHGLSMHMDETPNSSLDAGKEGFRRSGAHLSLGLLCRSHQRTPAQTLGPACEYPDFRGLAGLLAAVDKASVVHLGHAKAHTAS